MDEGTRTLNTKKNKRENLERLYLRHGWLLFQLYRESDFSVATSSPFPGQMGPCQSRWLALASGFCLLFRVENFIYSDFLAFVEGRGSPGTGLVYLQSTNQQTAAFQYLILGRYSPRTQIPSTLYSQSLCAGHRVGDIAGCTWRVSIRSVSQMGFIYLTLSRSLSSVFLWLAKAHPPLPHILTVHPLPVSLHSCLSLAPLLPATFMSFLKRHPCCHHFGLPICQGRSWVLSLSLSPPTESAPGRLISILLVFPSPRRHLETHLQSRAWLWGAALRDILFYTSSLWRQGWISLVLCWGERMAGC